jgi:hypothetical protein
MNILHVISQTIADTGLVIRERILRLVHLNLNESGRISQKRLGFTHTSGDLSSSSTAAASTARHNAAFSITRSCALAATPQPAPLAQRHLPAARMQYNPSEHM